MRTDGRGRLCVVVDDRPVTLAGEMFWPSPGRVGFEVYSRMMKRWEDGQPISAEDKQKILDHVRREAAELGLVVEID